MYTFGPFLLIISLRFVCCSLELAVDSRDGVVAAWAAENEDFQRLVDSVEATPAPEDVKMQKMLHKTSKEIYKLRRTRLPKGQPDFVSFK